jgi:hypothetical protein
VDYPVSWRRPGTESESARAGQSDNAKSLNTRSYILAGSRNPSLTTSMILTATISSVSSPSGRRRDVQSRSMAMAMLWVISGSRLSEKMIASLMCSASARRRGACRASHRWPVFDQKATVEKLLAGDRLRFHGRG